MSLTCRAASLSLRGLTCLPGGSVTALTSSLAASFPGKDTDVFREEVPGKAPPSYVTEPTRWRAREQGMAFMNRDRDRLRGGTRGPRGSGLEEAAQTAVQENRPYLGDQLAHAGLGGLCVTGGDGVGDALVQLERLGHGHLDLAGQPGASG